MSLLYKNNEDPKAASIAFISISVVIGFIVILSAFNMTVMPRYRVWQQGLEGQAEYSRAEQNRRIKILEAEAKKDSAKLLAEAEVERAKGVRQSNEIIADSLKGHEEYLRYLWIQNVGVSEHQIIYVPTEAGLPILEAGKR